MFKKFQSDILFTGYYGQLNTGDDAFIEVTSWGAEKYWNKNGSIFLGREENLPYTLRSIRGYPLSFPKTTAIQNKLLISSTDYLISAGGSILCSKFHNRDIKNYALKEKVKGRQVKLGGIGVSVGPFKTVEDEKAIQNYLYNLNFLAVRDQASFDYLKSLDLPFEPVNAFDLAALLPEIYGLKKKKAKDSNKKVIGVSVCPVETISNINPEAEKMRNKKTVELLSLLDKNENIHFKFFVINGHKTFGDYNLTKEIISQVSPASFELVEYNKNTEFMWNSVINCDFVISTRLHAAIFSCFGNTPFMLNEYHRKCSDFLEDVGYHSEYRLFNNEYDPLEKSQQIIEIINNKINYKLPTRLNEMKCKAEYNFTKVDL